MSYALPVGQGIVRDYPVMQLGALEYDIVRKIDQDENPRKVFDELAISYMIAEEQRDSFGRIFAQRQKTWRAVILFKIML